MNTDKPRTTHHASRITHHAPRITHHVALLGWPVEHSVSPAMHNAAFAALGLSEVWHYELWPTEPARLAAAVARLRAEGFPGANVTVPHKQAIMPHLDDLTDDAQAIGAVNTVVRHGDALLGDNTDADGFVLSLSKAGFAILGVRALVVGAGGAARAVVHGLLKLPVIEVLVLNRSLARAEALAGEIETFRGGRRRLRPLPLTAESLVDAAHDSDLLINATPVGTWPDTAASIWPEGVPIPHHMAVFDLVYNPQETRLLQQARASGARPVGGLEMLVQQGRLAFHLWTGRRAPVDVMREAAEKSLATRDT